MEELSQRYEPSSIESKWYSYWLDRGLFHSVPDSRTPYTIVIPPPNVTGVLHMGHMLNNTLQDVLVRRARMKGFNACWVPGTDHASIATEARVVAKLHEEGIQKASLSREEFLNHAWDWTHKHGGIILQQLRRLGASCDWERTAFTMDEARSESVIKVFVDLYRKGLVYKGVRMVNWDPQAKTALSDEEVIHRDTHGKLYYLAYKVVGSDRRLLVATTRPETVMGDVAVCVHPDDERYKNLVGSQVVVPMVGRKVPIIADEYVDREFGTGALKITPAHDINDYRIGVKYHLPSIDIFEEDGTIAKVAECYVGLDRFEARKRIVEDMRANGLLEKEEEYLHSVGYSERTDAVVEPRLSTQWFLRMEGLTKPALKAVLEGEVRLIPPKFVNTYRHWMENVRDWCISRQLWWGHRIPAWYYGEGGVAVAETPEQALEQARKESGNPSLGMEDLRQDEDVLDTWFSSWLWPIAVFDGIRHPENPEINYYYPTQDLVTAPEILFFWVARMVMAGYEYRNARPFERVYLTGIVRDGQRRKMSKSLGNSPDPITLIEKYGADGVRVGMLLCASAGNDLLFDEALTEQGRNFCNKVWNAYRLVHSWPTADREDPKHVERAIRVLDWFDARLARVLAIVEEHFSGYRISDALLELYRFFWDEYSAWVLELLKPPYGESIAPSVKERVERGFDKLLAWMHPFMPFITEELWHATNPNRKGQSIMEGNLVVPTVQKGEALEAEFAAFREIVTTVRNFRKQNNIGPKVPLHLSALSQTMTFGESVVSMLRDMAYLEKVEVVSAPVPGAFTFVVGGVQYFLPLPEGVSGVDRKKELKAELERLQRFLDSIQAKLKNARFVESAPTEVVERERQKAQDTEQKINVIRQQLEK